MTSELTGRDPRFIELKALRHEVDKLRAENEKLKAIAEAANDVCLAYPAPNRMVDLKAKLKAWKEGNGRP